MAELDEIFEVEQPAEEKNETGKMTREEWQIKREQARIEAFELLETVTDKLFAPEALTAYLDVQSRFGRYSVSNAILIAEYKPDATRLADFGFWKEHEVNIKKGERAVTILEPREYERADGTKGVSYESKRVFDISQTTAEQRTRPPKPVNEKTLIKALTKTSPVPIRIDNSLPEGVGAIYAPETKSISIRQGMTKDEIFRALAPEIVKARADMGDRQTNGFEIAAAAYILCKRNNIDSPVVPDAKAFEGKEAKEVRAVLRTVRDETNNMSSVMEKALQPKDRDAR